MAGEARSREDKLSLQTLTALRDQLCVQLGLVNFAAGNFCPKEEMCDHVKTA